MTKSAKTLLPAVGYKGGKRKFAAEIASILLAEGGQRYYDLCCGSGAVFLALISNGVSPQSITAVEAGPWGDYWRSISTGKFDIGLLDRLLHHDCPSDGRKVKDWVEREVAAMPVSPETFIVLQAAGFGSVPTWHDGTRWRHNEPGDNRAYHARGYWEPGANSKETKPRGTIFDSRGIVERVSTHLERCIGLRAIKGLVEKLVFGRVPGVRDIHYLDPPYLGVNGYSHSLDVEAFVARSPRPLFVSEARPMPGADQVIRLGERRSGNVRISKDASKRGAGRASEVELVSVFREPIAST